jgi:hypothetical protein
MAANDILRVPGNYTVQSTNGQITLDTTAVVIKGDLTVIGTQTNIQTTNSTIKDNLIVLNSGETNSNPFGQVTLGTAGIKIARGNSDDDNLATFLLYDDSFTWSPSWSPGTVSTGTWKLGASNSGLFFQLGGLTTLSYINTLTIFGSYNPLGVISVEGTTNYENQVVHDDHIPNKKYVDNLSASTEFAKKLVVGFSSVELKDNNVSTSSVAYYSAVPTLKVMLGTSTNAATVFQLQGTVAQFYGLSLTDNTISPRNTNTDIIVSPSGTGAIQLEGALRIEKTTAIASTASFTGIYSTSTVGGGGTGLYFVNTANTDELVSRRRSIIYGIIF